MYSITVSAMNSIIEAARSTHPNEFIALLEIEGKKITGLVILPSVFGGNFSSMRLDLLPLSPKISGSVHSHPGFNNRPSQGDLFAFPKIGKVHLIICQPYNVKSARAYDSKGREQELEVVA